MPNTLKRVPLSALVDNDNVRSEIVDVEELAESIVNTGLLEPLVTFKEGDGYVVVAGHRRKAAIALAIANGLLAEDYPIEIIVRAKVSREEQVAMMLVENMQRVDLPVKDQVHGIFALVSEHGWTQARVAEQLGQSVNMVKQRAKWGVLPDELLDRVDAGNLGMKDLDALVKLPTPAQQKLIAKGKKLSQWDIEAEVREQKSIGETRAFVRNLGKLGHLAVDAAAQNVKGAGMPTDAAAFIENLGDDKTTTKIDVWSPKDFLARAEKIIVPAVLLVVKHGYNWKVDVITSVDNAGDWKTKDRHMSNEDAVDDEDLTDYEREEARLSLAREAAIEERRATVKALQAAYLNDTKPSVLIAAVLESTIKRNFRHNGLIGAALRDTLNQVLDVELPKDDSLGQRHVLDFASKNSTNLARIAAAFALHEYGGIEAPGTDDLPDVSWGAFRIDGLRYDEDGRRLSDEEYAVAVAEDEAERAEREAQVAAIAAEAELEEGEEISEEELAAIRDELDAVNEIEEVA